MGNVLKELCRLDEAKACYQKCIGINPNYIEAYIGLGKVLLDFNKLDESAVVFKRALKLKPENAKLHRHLSEVIKYKKMILTQRIWRKLFQIVKLPKINKCIYLLLLVKFTRT